MSRFKNKSGSEFGMDMPFTDMMKQTHDFITSRRRIRTSAGTEVVLNYEIMQRKQFESGVAGNSVSQRDFIDRGERAERALVEHVKQQCALWTHIKEQQQKILCDMQASGSTDPGPLPHPDDILIDPRKGVQILGPMDSEDAMRWARSRPCVRHSICNN